MRRGMRLWSRRAGASACLSIGLLACAAGLLWALDWPVATVKLAATFGTPATGRLVTGVAIAASDGLVRSIDDGQLAFAFDSPTTPSGLPSTLGSFAIVQHANDIAAVYAHLVPGSVSSYLKATKRGAILGSIGSSGWSEGPGLLLELYDRHAGDWVNPLLLLPPLPDERAPVIRSVALMSTDKVYVLGESSSVPQATYRIAADVAETSNASWTVGPLAPYSIRLSIDGIEIARKVFDLAVGKDGRLCLFPDSPASLSDLRTKDGRYLLGERLLTRGRWMIELSVSDVNGNRRSASWSVVVQ